MIMKLHLKTITALAALLLLLLPSLSWADCIAKTWSQWWSNSDCQASYNYVNSFNNWGAIDGNCASNHCIWTSSPSGNYPCRANYILCTTQAEADSVFCEQNPNAEGCKKQICEPNRLYIDTQCQEKNENQVICNSAGCEIGEGIDLYSYKIHSKQCNADGTAYISDDSTYTGIYAGSCKNSSEQEYNKDLCVLNGNVWENNTCNYSICNEYKSQCIDNSGIFTNGIDSSNNCQYFCEKYKQNSNSIFILKTNTSYYLGYKVDNTTNYTQIIKEQYDWINSQNNDCRELYRGYKNNKYIYWYSDETAPDDVKNVIKVK